MSAQSGRRGPERAPVEMSDPTSLAFRARVESAAQAPVLLVATDFDGTIAPFMDDPQAVTPLPGAVESLVELSTLPGTTAGLVSGRDLETLSRLSGAPAGVTLVGSHGGQSTDPDIAGTGELSPEQKATIDRLSEGAEALAARHPGMHVEYKAAAVVIHVRQIEDVSQRRKATDEATAMFRDRYGVDPMLGNNVIEAAVLKASKGHALTRLADRLGADAVVYLGDDVTDETAFEAFKTRPGALMIKVGEGETAGNARLPGPQAAVDTLAALTELRKETSRTS